MKEINELLEIMGKSYLKYFVIFFVGLFFVEFALFFVGLESIDSAFHTSLSRTSWLTLLILYAIHSKRYKNIIGNGSLNRIMLLPIKKMSFIYSELFFVGSTIVMLFVVNFFAWYLSLVLTQAPTIPESIQLVMENPGLLFYQSFTSAMSTELPICILNIVSMIGQIITFSYIGVLILVTKNDVDIRYTPVSFVIFVFIGTRFITIGEMSYMMKNLIFVVCSILIILLMHTRLNKRFGRKVKMI